MLSRAQRHGRIVHSYVQLTERLLAQTCRSTQACRTNLDTDVYLNCRIGNSSSGGCAADSQQPRERVKGNTGLNTIFYFGLDGVAYENPAYSEADITELVDDHRLESLTSTDLEVRLLVHSVDAGVPTPNQSCHRLILGTGFTTKTMPLLRGGLGHRP